ncbi:MAG: DUF91 domain-containing protein [Chloroflexi bacterium]|nr:MAG: DUF91 domain-containing protein [Chloroflexota bacterium]
MSADHIVVTLDSEGNISTYPLKQWLRQHPEENPQGMHPDQNTSHQLRRAMKKQGWGLEIGADEVLIVKPDGTGDTTYADQLVEIRDEQGGETELAKDESSEVTFGLEKDMQASLRLNIDELEEGLEIIDGGAERTTEAGRIDILCKDKNNKLVVIELKAGVATNRVVAQTLAYMAAVADMEKTEARGIIVAGDFSKRVVLAASAVPNLELVLYSIKFSFESIGH